MILATVAALLATGFAAPASATDEPPTTTSRQTICDYPTYIAAIDMDRLVVAQTTDSSCPDVNVLPVLAGWVRCYQYALAESTQSTASPHTDSSGQASCPGDNLDLEDFYLGCSPRRVVPDCVDPDDFRCHGGVGWGRSCVWVCVNEPGAGVHVQIEEFHLNGCLDPQPCSPAPGGACDVSCPPGEVGVDASPYRRGATYCVAYGTCPGGVGVHVASTPVCARACGDSNEVGREMEIGNTHASPCLGGQVCLDPPGGAYITVGSGVVDGLPVCGRVCAEPDAGGAMVRVGGFEWSACLGASPCPPGYYGVVAAGLQFCLQPESCPPPQQGVRVEGASACVGPLDGGWCQPGDAARGYWVSYPPVGVPCLGVDGCGAGQGIILVPSGLGACATVCNAGTGVEAWLPGVASIPVCAAPEPCQQGTGYGVQTALTPAVGACVETCASGAGVAVGGQGVCATPCPVPTDPPSAGVVVQTPLGSYGGCASPPSVGLCDQGVPPDAVGVVVGGINACVTVPQPLTPCEGFVGYRFDTPLGGLCL